MTRVPPIRSAFALVASVTLTFIIFQQSATLPASPAVAATHPRAA